MKELQNTTGSQISRADTLQLEKISKTSDLLNCKVMRSQVLAVGKESVLTEIRLSVEKCAMALNIKMTDSQVIILCQDILSKYNTESIEDVRECFKKGRLGYYGFGMNSRNSLNMIILSEWMELHLIEKSKAREEHQRKLKISKKKLDNVDYEAYKIRMKEEDKKEKPESKNDEGYNKFKNEWIRSRNK